MSRRRLVAGRDEFPLGIGCRPLGGPACNRGRAAGWAAADDGDLVDGLLQAQALGVTVFDTSDVYGFGHSQRLLGRMLAQVPRESVRLTCAVGAFQGTGLSGYSALTLHGQIQQSLENLGTDYLDVLTLQHHDFGPRDRYLNETLETLQALRDLGAVKALGMITPHRSATSIEAPARAEGAARFAYLFQRVRPDVLSTTYDPLSPDLHDDQSNKDVFGFSGRHEAATLVCQPLAMGLLTGKYGPESVFKAGDVRTAIPASVLDVLHRGLQPLRDRFGTAPQELVRVALHHTLRRCPDAVVLTGFTSLKQVTANLRGLGDELSDGEYAFAHSVYQELGQRLRALGHRVTRPPSIHS
ncbi:aldo/keto reductase [Streptomyces sp. NPDC055103]